MNFNRSYGIIGTDKDVLNILMDSDWWNAREGIAFTTEGELDIGSERTVNVLADILSERFSGATIESQTAFGSAIFVVKYGESVLGFGASKAAAIVAAMERPMH